MSPHQKSEHRDSHAGARDPGVTEDSFARKTGDQFADHAHTGQNHDVNRRMRIKPEHVLEQNWIAAEVRVEDSHAPDSFESDQTERDREHRRRKHHDQTGRVERPNEQRQPKPRQTRRAHLVRRDNEIYPGHDGGKTGHEHTGRHRDHVRVCVSRAVRRVKRPASIDASAN